MIERPELDGDVRRTRRPIALARVGSSSGRRRTALPGYQRSGWPSGPRTSASPRASTP
jgi:hypothetical protein